MWKEQTSGRRRVALLLGKDAQRQHLRHGVRIILFNNVCLSVRTTSIEAHRRENTKLENSAEDYILINIPHFDKGSFSLPPSSPLFNEIISLCVIQTLKKSMRTCWKREPLVKLEL